MKLNISRTSVLFLALAWCSASLSLAQELDPALKDLINKGLHKSHSINIYDLDAEQAKADQKMAKSVFVPNVSISGSYTRLNDDIKLDDAAQQLLMGTQKLLIKEAVGMPFNAPLPPNTPLTEIPNIQDRNILKSSVDLDWVLFSGFEVTNAVKASKHKEASLHFLGDAQKDKIALQIIETYDKLALVYASEEVLVTSESYLKEQETYAKKAVANGLTTPIARKKIELAQQQLAAKELEYNHNKTLLIQVLHQLTGESTANLALLKPELQSLSSPSPVDTNKRNEIKALEEAEQASMYKSKMQKSSFIPKIALKGHYELIDDDLSLLDPKWFVGVGVRWNLFDGFESKLKSQKSTIERLKYKEQREEAEEVIALSAIKAQLGTESAIQNARVAQKEVELATATYDMVNKQYKNNLASINDVLNALSDVEKANFKLQQSYFNQRRAHADLLHANGILTSLYN